METTQMPVDVWKDKQNTVCTYSGILFSLEKERNSDTWNNMNDPWKCHAKWNKPHTKGQILHYSPYMSYLEESRASQVALVVKNLPADVGGREMWVQSLGWEDLLEAGLATNSSIVAWRIPRTEEPDGLQPVVSQTVRQDWSNLTCTHRTVKSIKTESRTTVTRGWKRDNRKSLFNGFGSVAESCPTLCNPMNWSTPGFPVRHQLREPAQTHVHWVSDAIQPSHPLSSPSPPALNLSQNQGVFQWVTSSHQVAKV